MKIPENTNQLAAGKSPTAESASRQVIDPLLGLWTDLAWLAHDQMQLLTLELRTAGESLAAMLAYAVVVGVLLVSAWIGLMAVLVLALVSIGIAVSAAVVLVVVLNLLAAGALAFVIRRLSRALSFPATVDSLQPGETA